MMCPHALVRLSSACAIVTLVGSFATPAHAQDDLERAKDLFKKGEKLYKKQKFKEAAEAFTEAYELSKRDELLYYMGTSWEALGELVVAQRYYQLYLNNLPDAPNAEKILDKVIELQRRIREEMGRVVLTTNMDESDVFVDRESEPRCQTPCTVALSPEVKHTLKIVDAKGREITKTFVVEAGEKREVELSTEPTIKEGFLLVRSDVPDATLKVDATPYPLGQPIELEEGSYTVSLTGDGSGQTWQGTLDVTANDTNALLIPLSHMEAEGSGLNFKRAGAYSLISVGAGLLIGGALMGRQANTSFTTLEERRSSGVAQDSSLVSQGRSQQRAANILFLAGGVTLAGGSGLLAWDILSRDKGPSPEPSPAKPVDELDQTDDKEDDKEDQPKVDLID